MCLRACCSTLPWLRCCSWVVHAAPGLACSLKQQAALRPAHSLTLALVSGWQGLGFPLLENANEYVLQGFSFQDYLRQVEYPQAKVGALATLDRALQTAFNITRGEPGRARCGLFRSSPWAASLLSAGRPVGSCCLLLGASQHGWAG